MKAIKMSNDFQYIDSIPNIWNHYPVYEILNYSIRPNQKRLGFDDAIVDEEKKTIMLSVVDLSESEYTEKLTKEALKIELELKNVLTDLELGARKYSIGKEGNESYIKAQESTYLRKYAIAKNEIPDYNDLLKSEAIENEMILEDYKILIVGKHESSKTCLNTFLAMIERSRVKVLFLTKNLKNQKANEVIDLMKSIKSDSTIEEIEQTMSVILKYS